MERIRWKRGIKMPVREYKCPDCDGRLERVEFGPLPLPPCFNHFDGEEHVMEKVEFSLTARRNPEHGIVK
jgi:hypothetical protein